MAKARKRTGSPVRYKNDLWEVLAWDGDWRTKDRMYGHIGGKEKAACWTHEEARAFAEDFMRRNKPMGKDAQVRISEAKKSGDTYWHELWKSNDGSTWTLAGTGRYVSEAGGSGHWGIWDATGQAWCPDPLRGGVDISPVHFESRAKAERAAKPWRELNPERTFEVRPIEGEGKLGYVREESHHVADFNTLPELIEHARKEGATHFVERGREIWLFYPASNDRLRPWREATIWNEGGYWHAEGPSNRSVVASLPKNAKPIESFRGMSEAQRGIAEHHAAEPNGAKEARRRRRGKPPLGGHYPVDPDDLRRAVSMYQPAQVFINGRYQASGTITPTHTIEREAETMLRITGPGDVIDVKQGENVWSFTRTEDGLTRATHRFEDAEGNVAGAGAGQAEELVHSVGETGPTTKPGKHGTLYLYEIKYTDPSDNGMGELTTRVWAYNLEHAEERFYEGPDSDGWRIISLSRVPESGGMHRATRHRPMRESPTVRDYIAVDRNDRKVAGPFRTRGEAEPHVPAGGYVKFSSAQHRRAPPAPSSYPMFREARAKRRTKNEQREVTFECDTPRNYRWLMGQILEYPERMGTRLPDGWIRLPADESRFQEALRAAGGHIIESRPTTAP